MTQDELLAGLFPDGHTIGPIAPHLIAGHARVDGADALVIGIADGAPLDGDGVLALAAPVLDHIERGGDAPILVLVDTEGQRMSRREEQLGLYEYLAHLAKCLLLASNSGHRTLGILYGQAAAGAFLATALATDALVCVGERAAPAVMDLKSVARVTKLPIGTLKELAEKTPVFAPGVGPMVEMGAVAETWTDDQPLAPRLAATLRKLSAEDRRAALGAERGGRRHAEAVIARVIAEAGHTA